MGKEKFSEEIEKSTKELMKARKEKTFWHYASIIGVGGWLFVIPIIAGAYLGRYLDKRFVGGISWTITFIIIGIAAGIYNFWFFYMRRTR
jgi:ATP synthase protein I